MKLAKEPFEISARGTMLYIRRTGGMTGTLTRTHGTGPDTSTVQFRPSCKCVINMLCGVFMIGCAYIYRIYHMYCIEEPLA